MALGALAVSSIIGFGTSLLASDAQKKADKENKKRAAAFKAEQDRIMRETKPEEAGALFAAGAKRETDPRGANAFLSPLSIGV
jgi:hypothetical protein